MRLGVLLVLVLPMLHGQTCPPARMLPAANASGALDSSSCLLSDGTPYAAYRLDLPARGKLQITLDPGAADLILMLRDSSGVQIGSGLSVQRNVEAGSYTVLVNGHAPGQAGAYSVQTAFTAEPGMLCLNFASAGLSQTLKGTLGASGCVLPDGTPYEGYLLNTFGSGTLTVSLSSTAFTPLLIVRSSDGHALASDPATVTVPVTGDNQYQIVVATADQTGAYQLTTSFQAAAADVCRALKSFSDSAKDNGSITADSCTLALPGSGDLAYYNYYFLNVSAAGLADLQVSSTDFVPTLYLLDDGGNVLTLDSGGGGNGQSEVRMQVPPGKYTVEIFSNLPSGGAYTFTYSLSPGAPQPCTAAALNPGDSHNGTLSPSSCRSSVGLADLYNITLPAYGTLELDLTSGNFTGLIALRDTKDNLIVLNQDLEELGDSHLTADLPAGIYTVVPAAISGAGNYQLKTTMTAHNVPACAQVTPLDINGGYIQKLGNGPCRAANGQPVDYYQFTLPNDSVVAAVMTSSDVDGHLDLLDSNGTVLRSDDTSYGDGNPLIVQFLRAGTYRLAARAISSTIGGLYEVDLRNIPGSRPAFCAAKGTIAPGGSINGAINLASCQYADSTFADLYQFTIASDSSVDLRLNSASFDAYLVLLDAKGNVVDQDDDSGGGTNARIQRPLSAGTYFVVAKPFGDYTSQGNYTLLLAQSALQ